MCARTDLWEPWAGNRPGPPGHYGATAAQPPRHRRPRAGGAMIDHYGRPARSFRATAGPVPAER